MIEELASLIDNFPGAANHMCCFLHIINLVAKSVLRQFELKAKVDNSLSEAARALAALSDELESSTGDHEDNYYGGSDGDEDDDDEGLPDGHADLSDEEITVLEEDIQPVCLVLAKVKSFQTPTQFVC